VDTTYPAHLATDVVLRDGSTLHIRPATAGDFELVEDYVIGLSEETRRLRFWTPSIDVTEHARRTVDVDFVNHLTLIATIGAGEERMVGGAQYFRVDGSARAEMSVSIADELQGHGLGSILVGHLAQAAREHGITTFLAEVLPENHRMIEVFRNSGFIVTIHAKPGVVEVEFPTTITATTIEQFDERERLAAANAVRQFLEAKSVAVIGASRDPGSIGGRLLRNLLIGPFTGVVYPVNATAPVVQGVTAFPSILDVPGDVELAIVAVKSPYVLDVVDQCGRKGVRSLVVISSGFGEIGKDGLGLQQQLVRLCRDHGMRLIGPNCMGIVNTDPDVRLNATFATTPPAEGRVAFMSQSGALGLAVMAYAANLGIGLSSFVSVGNKADISANDFLCYWDEDERTEVLLLYMESFGNPRRFGRLARRIGRNKPIIAVKSGRRTAGLRATGSHTGALLAANDATVDAVFHQHGVIRTDTLEEMFDVASLLVHQPVPKGNNVAIITNAGGLGIQCVDACEAWGLTVPVLAPETVTELRAFLPPEASTANPVDMIASAKPEHFSHTIQTVAHDPGVDALIVIYIPPLEQDAPAIAQAMIQSIGSLDRRIPVLTSYLSSRGIPAELRSPELGIPTYAFPEQAAIALAHAARYGAWRRKPEGHVPELTGIREDEAHAVVAGALERGPEVWLTPEEVATLFDCYELPRAREASVTTPEAAEESAKDIGAKVALKAIGPVHKTDVGGVALDVAPDDVLAEAQAMAARLAERGERLDGFVVQEMMREGTEMLVGAVTDPVFGPVIAVGAGGVTVELTRDVAVRVAPLTDLDSDEMVHELSTFPLLDGFRGAPKKDVAALVDVILRVSALADHHPEILEMDCNPVIVLPTGAAIIDARIKVHVPTPAPPFAARAGD
jgi:acetate---CoA ligase (ADP-forming)